MKQTARTLQKENTKKTLIETALQLFSKQGIATTTTLELAKIAQVSHGTIFAHFPTRETLLFEVINVFGDNLALAFDEAAKNANSTKAILEAHLQVLAEFEDFYTCLIEELPALQDKVKSRFYLLQAAISQHIYLHAQQDMEKGTLKTMERAKLFNTWIALIHYHLLNKDVFCPGKPLIASYGEELLNHFLYLITK